MGRFAVVIFLLFFFVSAYGVKLMADDFNSEDPNLVRKSGTEAFIPQVSNLNESTGPGLFPENQNQKVLSNQKKKIKKTNPR